MSLTLLDWRRRTQAMYAAVRRSPDPQDAWLGWRAARDRLFRTHPDTPLLEPAAHRELPFAPYDPALRFVAPVLPAEPATHAVPVSEGTVQLTRVGRVELPVGSLDLWWLGGYAGGLFVPFADATNRDTTYGGGRYLIDTVKGADLGGDSDGLLLDFNFAYHPSCRYNPRWSCPLAPAGNRLDVPIVAGEQL
ncbi:DUF1684 domain-containing protein [Motilibacter deserti]|uniref:DUF1684 domain-containing protein n=1 Tax=Motilibacter deserti TaxID=2714956 RepID=UPI002F2B3C0F